MPPEDAPGAAAPGPPLAGVRVLDLTRLLPGAYGTLLLADLGAAVVKVEDLRTGGDPMRSVPPLVDGVGAGFRALHRGKRSVAVDMGSEAGRDAIARLASAADALVEGFRPGVMEARGIGHAVLTAANPALVWCSLTGFGQTGPWRDRAGHDLNYQALAGALASAGGGGPPAVPSVQAADLAGGMLAALGVLAALPSAAATGRGRRIDVSMHDAAVSLLSIHAAAALAGDERGAAGGILSGSHACYRLYPTADGRTVSVGALEPKFWARLCAEVGCPDLVADQFAPPPRQAEMIDRLAAVFLTRTAAEWEAALGHLDVCVAPVLTPPEALSTAQAAARRMLAGDEGGPSGPGGPIAMDGLAEDLAWGRAPRLGEHTREVLAEAGLSEREIAALAEAGAI